MKISTGESLMKELLNHSFSEHSLNNYRPSWLGGLELDRYYPSLYTAYEFQGEHHFEYSFSLYPSHQNFLEQVKRDRKKKEILSKRKIELVEFTAKDLDLNEFSKRIAAPSSIIIPSIIRERIQNYQKGLTLQRKNQIKTFLSQTNWFWIRTHFSYIQEKIAFFSFSPFNFSYYEKIVLLLLVVLSKNGEVQFSIPQLKQLLPNVQWEKNCFLLEKKEAIFIQKDFFLIKVEEVLCSKIFNFLKIMMKK